MSKALTAGNRKFQGVVDDRAEQLIDFDRSERFPSYFGNLGNFFVVLMHCVNARLTTRHCRAKREFPLITAIMAIV
jgi:hypothetical protein